MKHPMQPVYLDEHGTVRFRHNAIVRFLLDYCHNTKGMSLNEIAMMPFDDDDRAQFAQLIGYSVGGYGELSYAKEVERADEIAAELYEQIKGGK